MSNNKYKILVIEDEANIRSFMDTILESNGYQPLSASTCAEGKLMFSSHRPDLVILDLGLPDEDGTEYELEVLSTLEYNGFTYLAVVISINLGVMNLLPIPVLDGGLIMFALFALVFRRRVPDFIVKWLSLGCMVILMGLMALLIGRDSWKSWKIHTYQPSSGGTGDSCATNELQNATSPSR